MSKKSQELKTSKVLSFDELSERWKECAWWNTSTGIASECKIIESTASWSQFSVEYDLSKHQEHRLREWHRTREWRGFSFDLIDLKDLARLATGRKTSHLAPSLQGISKAEAGERLGNIFLQLCCRREEDKFRDFSDGVRLQYSKASNVADVVWAFSQFVKRNSRLPTKQELNSEANLIDHLKNLLVPKDEKRVFKAGEIIEWGYAKTKFRIYDISENYDADDGMLLLHACPAEEWDDKFPTPRWEHPPTFSGILRKAGLSGLPQRRFGGA
jgi:hypothetical protein